MMQRQVALLALALLAAPSGLAGDFSALVFTKTTGYRHDSIPDGVNMLRSLPYFWFFYPAPTAVGRI